MEAIAQKIVVDAKSQYGVKDKLTDKWLNPQDKALLEQFNVGTEYEVELIENEGKSGKKFLNISKIIKVGETVKAEKKAWNGGAKRNYPTPAEREKEARGKSLHGFICAALSSPKVTMFNDNEKLFAWVDQVVAYGMGKLGFKD